MSHFPWKRTALSLCVSALGAMLLSGCSTNFQPSPLADVASEHTPIGEINGSVHGGNFPVTGASIYLFATGTGGYGTASTSLITSGKAGVSCNANAKLNGTTYSAYSNACHVTTDAYGNFALSGDYACTAGQQVYMVAVGGNPGVGGTTPFATTANYAKNSTTMTVTSATGITVGMAVTGTGVSATVTKVTGTTITLSQQTTVKGTNASVTFSTTTGTFSNGGYTITLASAAGIAVGNIVGGTGVAGIVTAVNGTTVTLSQQNTATGSGIPVTFSAPVSNPYLVQMVGLGRCPAAGNLAAQVPYIDVDEITTVAFAYSMAGFAKDEFDIATDGTAAGATAIQIAMANSMNIADISRGTAPAVTLTANSSGTPPMNKMVALADILATCVNTTGALNNGTSSQPCYNLLQNGGAVFAGSGASMTSTSDEAQTIFYIAQNPASANVTNIFNLLPATPVWTTTLTSAADWALPVVYKNVVSSQPGNIAFDSAGNAWISDRGNGAVVKITPTGVVNTFTNLNNGSSNGSIHQVAVDPSDTIWALDYTNSQIYRLDKNGNWLSTITANGTNQLSSPIAISFNASGSALVLNSGSNYISRFSASGVVQTPATYNQSGSDGYGGIGAPPGIAVDGGGNAFIPENVGCTCVGILVNNSGNELAFDDYSGKVGNATAIAMDASNNAWQAQGSSNSIVEDPTYSNGEYQNYSLNFFNFFPTLTGYYFNLRSVFGFPIAVAPTTLTGGGLNNPVALTFDGAGYLWAANSGASTVSGFNGTTSLAGTTGFQTGSSGATYGVATDPAGNVWTANSDGSVTEILGLATPTATPVYPGQIAVTP